MACQLCELIEHLEVACYLQLNSILRGVGALSSPILPSLTPNLEVYCASHVTLDG